MILSDTAIVAAHAVGNIRIEPWCDDQLNGASYDLRLSDEVVIYKTGGVPHDSKQEPTIKRETIGPYGYVVRPGQMYLMATRERFGSTKYVPVLDGKSSIGRLGVSVHQTAGYGDPGFFGQWTLEVTCALPDGVRIYAGMRIAQVRFHAIMGAVERTYAGNYASDAMGPVASRAWRQFNKG